MKKILALTLVLSSLGLKAAPMNASSLRLKVYKMAVSTQPNCSNPTVIFTKSNPSYTDFKNNPDLGSGNLADGTYPCVIIEFSDNIKITPDGNGTYCQIATEDTQDVCSSQDWNGDGDTTDPGETTTATLIDGSTTTCTNGDDRVAMYLTTASTQTNEVDAFNPPACNIPGCATSGPGINLASALSVSGTAVGQFSVNTDGKVCDGNDGFPGGNCGPAQATNPCACESASSCNMMVPGFSFSQI